MNNWISCHDNLSSENIVVETKISDNQGERNVTELFRYKNLWFFPDMSMYVYYSPTHWRKIDLKKYEKKEIN